MMPIHRTICLLGVFCFLTTQYSNVYNTIYFGQTTSSFHSGIPRVHTHILYIYCCDFLTAYIQFQNCGYKVVGNCNHPRWFFKTCERIIFPTLLTLTQSVPRLPVMMGSPSTYTCRFCECLIITMKVKNESQTMMTYFISLIIKLDYFWLFWVGIYPNDTINEHGK